MSSYGHYKEIVVHDKRDALYGGTRRLVATLNPEASSELEASPSSQSPKTEFASVPAPEPESVVASISETVPELATSPALPPGNGSREVWAAHAVSLGLIVTDDLARNDIRALVDEHTKEN